MRTVPRAITLIAGAVFAIYFTLPLVALSALPVEEIDGELTTRLALPPEEGGYANDPILGVVQNLGLEGVTLDVAEIYVGILAATILFIATNAGVIGASRITYSMASYRQLPERRRRCIRASRRRGCRSSCSPASPRSFCCLPGDVNFVGTLYSLGATLSFTVAHAAIIRLRMRDRQRVGSRVPCSTRTFAWVPSAGRYSRWREASRPVHRSSCSSSRTRRRAGSGSAGWSSGSSPTWSTGAASCTRR